MFSAAQQAGLWKAIHQISLICTVGFWFACGMFALQRLGGCRLPYWQQFYVTFGQNSEAVAHINDGGDEVAIAYDKKLVVATAYAHWETSEFSLPFNIYSNRRLMLNGSVEEQTNSVSADAVLASFATLRQTDASGVCAKWAKFNSTDAHVDQSRFEVPLTETRHEFHFAGLLGSVVFWGLPVMSVASRRRSSRWRFVAAGNELNRCPSCNYNMTGVRGVQCPECGRTHIGRKVF